MSYWIVVSEQREWAFIIEGESNYSVELSTSVADNLLFDYTFNLQKCYSKWNVFLCVLYKMNNMKKAKDQKWLCAMLSRFAELRVRYWLGNTKVSVYCHYSSSWNWQNHWSIIIKKGWVCISYKTASQQISSDKLELKGPDWWLLR